MNGWRNIKLFYDKPQALVSLAEKFNVCCLSEDFVCFGLNNGYLVVADKKGDNVKVVFNAYRSSILELRYNCKRKLLLTIGIDGEEDGPLIKLWSLESLCCSSSVHTQESQNRPLCQHSLQPIISSNNRSSEELSFGISSVAIDMTALAVGMINDEVMLFLGNLGYHIARTVHLRSRYGKGKLTFVFLAPVSNNEKEGLFVAKHSGTSEGRSLRFFTPFSDDLSGSKIGKHALYTVFEDAVTIWIDRGGEYTEFLSPVPFGSANGCCCSMGTNGLVVLKNDDGNEPSVQLAVIGCPQSDSAFDPTSPSSVKIIHIDLPVGRVPRKVLSCREYICLWCESQESDTHFLQAFDCTHYIRALGRTQQRYEKSLSVISDDQGITIISSDQAQPTEGQGQVVRLTFLAEHPSSVKLGIFLEKEMYYAAKKIAIAMNCEKKEKDKIIATISKLYGDYFYSKGFFTKAMTQYTDTIGFQEPSYVIVKYMKSNQLKDLTHYLEQIIESNFFDSKSDVYKTHYVRLFLHCLMKQEMTKKICSFLSHKKNEMNLELALGILREGKSFRDGRDIAEHYLHHLERVRFSFFDLNDHQDTMDYLHNIPPDDAFTIMKRYGRDFLWASPKESTRFLTDLFLSRINSFDSVEEEHLYFLHLFADNPLCLAHFIENIPVEKLIANKELDNNTSSVNETLIRLLMCYRLSSHSRKCAIHLNAEPSLLHDIRNQGSNSSLLEQLESAVESSLPSSSQYLLLLLRYTSGSKNALDAHLKKTSTKLSAAKQQGSCPPPESLHFLQGNSTPSYASSALTTILGSRSVDYALPSKSTFSGTSETHDPMSRKYFHSTRSYLNNIFAASNDEVEVW